MFSVDDTIVVQHPDSVGGPLPAFDLGGGRRQDLLLQQLVADVGAMTREMEVTSTSQQKVLEQAQTVQQSTSGVNLDEEASNLIRYQQAYQASGKVMEVASKLFDQILAIASAS